MAREILQKYPNHFRVTYYDGTNPPWKLPRGRVFESSSSTPNYARISPDNAEDVRLVAEFIAFGKLGEALVDDKEKKSFRKFFEGRRIIEVRNDMRGESSGFGWTSNKPVGQFWEQLAAVRNYDNESEFRWRRGHCGHVAIGALALGWVDIDYLRKNPRFMTTTSRCLVR